ncbi:glutaminyl-tRNA synthetase [Sporothrix brasiliensis 5110]|uniref:glutamine--tRNA ligase n=1 Tax=Sporothrix brasiliensis 5110 TaxID=1398154 RepID=A0A0C2FSL0_9PEZI|nr:glutaminyl-tRNA synthetase [Sporothrix brasiliensis 5110]KIH94013.1 glutaminyl-tRNA synthetase [Sporothrix brasiliensis 5110]
MADLVDSTAKLQLDEETGEMVSKGELKKRLKKREKAAATAKAKEAKAAAAASNPVAPNPKPAAAPKADEPSIDPQQMFKVGFLDEVFKIRPMKPVRTRFPPEPNGFLHIGHAKAIAVNFGFAKYHGGSCNLRYDDTNPESEEQVYFDAILDMITWLGFQPRTITYSSDNFDRLYAHAEQLIECGRAYVCQCTDAEIKDQRGGGEGRPRYRCKHAEQTVEHNLTEFRAMRDGKYKPQEAFLRMKQDIADGNPQMWDLAAYRVLATPHFRTGTKWKIYPTYDFTHCLCDSYEGITHSLCTTEFVLSRVSYEWLNHTLGVYEPMQREYGRLSMTGTVLSKRKILKLVESGIVRGWNDPRLYTLIGIKRRGVPPGAILEFVNELGVTTTNSVIDIKRFEQAVRKYLERTVPRLMLVLDPVPVVIEGVEGGEGGDEADADADAANLGGLDGKALSIPFNPKDPKVGVHDVAFSRTIYIDRADFREDADPSFFRLAPGKSVGLLQVPYPIRATSYTKDETTGRVTEIRAVLDRSAGTKKQKTYIQWVPPVDKGSRRAEVRVYNPLFKSDNPNDAEGGYLADINPDSEIVYPDALIESGFDEVRRRAPWPEAAGESELGKGGPESVRFQGIRVAYFAEDSDSTDEKIVLNRIVALKEDLGKK